MSPSVIRRSPMMTGWVWPSSERTFSSAASIARRFSGSLKSVSASF
jgi:hypothetical protein